MIDVRTAETDADLDAWRRVRLAVLPNERTPSVEELQRLETPEQLLLLAELDGRVAGSGIAGRSDVGGQGFVAPRVLPDARRHGVGTALLTRLAEHVSALGFPRAGSLVDDDGSLAFARRFGFREVDRHVEQVRSVGPDEQPPLVPDRAEIVSLAERPELAARVYHELAAKALEDIPVTPRLQVSFEDWEREWVTLPEGSFVALADGEIVGCAGLLRDDDRPERAEHGLTAVRRDWRGRGLAKALKQQTIVWAAANGLTELYTWTQRGNEQMQAVNERLGYVVRSTCWSVRGPVPLAQPAEV